MKPIEFEGQNIVFAKDQPEYLPLPAYRSLDGQVTSCWHLSFAERLRVLVTGKVFSTLLSFNKPLTPQLLSTKWKP